MFVLYDGPSLHDGKPILVLATGFDRPSSNDKTGPMVQTYILRKDMSPTEALKAGEDESICGDCVLRDGGCYVVVHMGPNSVYRRWLKEKPKPLTIEQIQHIGTNRTIRIGAYGDPATAPVWVWENLLTHANGYTGYTHAWRTCDPILKSYCMASVDTEYEAKVAQALGWRTYRAKEPGEENLATEIDCPHSDTIKCFTCLLCKGGENGRSITIPIHGAEWKQRRFKTAVRPSKNVVIFDPNEFRKMPVHMLPPVRAERTTSGNRPRG